MGRGGDPRGGDKTDIRAQNNGRSTVSDAQKCLLAGHFLTSSVILTATYDKDFPKSTITMLLYYKTQNRCQIDG